MNIIHSTILFPFFILGWIVGYFSRPFVKGYLDAFYFIELKERTKLTDELGNLISMGEEDESGNNME